MGFGEGFDEGEAVSWGGLNRFLVSQAVEWD